MKVRRSVSLASLLPVLLLVAFPSSSNFQLRSYEFGSGGGVGESSNYQLQGQTGEIAGDQSSATYRVRSGLAEVTQAAVPLAPTFVNSSNWYNKLHLTLDAGTYASDTLFSISISSDDWATTQYVQSDNTVGAFLGVEDYQTYTAWGGATGEDIIGLNPGTTYKVKVKAKQGNYTESDYGPEASAATANPTLSFDIDVASTDSESSPPYSVSLGEMSAGSVLTASERIWVDLSTNSENGAYIYIYDQYGGLTSSNTNYTISSVSNDLSSVSEGYGLRVNSTSNLTALSPYDGTLDTVGSVSTTVKELLQSTGQVSDGRASVLIKAKSSTTTPSASDYTDTLTFIAAGTF